MNALLLALLGLVGAGFLSFIIAVATGQLVPGSKLEEKEKEVLHWKAAADKWEHSYNDQKALVDRSAQSAEITDRVMTAMQTMFDRQQATKQVGSGGI